MRHGDGAQLMLGLLLIAVLIPLTLIDLDRRALSDAILLPAAAGAIVLGTLLDRGGEAERLLAAVLAAAFVLLVTLAFPRAMRLGDVKLAAVIGLFLGRGVGVALLVAVVAGVLVGVVLAVRKGGAQARRTAIRVGPLLAFGGVMAVLLGDGYINAYLRLF